MPAVHVRDAEGRELSPSTREKAERLVAEGQAEWLQEDPPTIRLHRSIPLPEPTALEAHPLDGKRLLLHVCCAPCATYTAQYLREQGADVTGFWYNPNIHPYSEHELRRETLREYAEQIALPVIWEPGYDMPAFLRAVCGHEQQGERCLICYRMRLERTAQVAAERGFDLFATTLLISPYQDLNAIERIGHELAEAHGIAFYFENLRRGFAEHHRMAREHDLYQQRYCGCIYSEWEARDRDATTRRRRGNGRKGSPSQAPSPGA
jgi:epoxyqueuosine reductase